MTWFTYVVVAAAALALAEGHSIGAPKSACYDMVPKHGGVEPQKGTSPYVITTNINTVKAGQPVVVTIRGKLPADTMRGLLLQARQGDHIVGKFTVPPNDTFLQTMECDAPADAVTQKKHENKEDKQSAVVTWTPPAGFSGDIKFRATVVKTGPVFWVGIESAPVKVTL